MAGFPEAVSLISIRATAAAVRLTRCAVNVGELGLLAVNQSCASYQRPFLNLRADKCVVQMLECPQT